MFYSDDPARDAFNKYEEDENEECIYCSECECEIFLGEHVWDIEGTFYCDDCAEILFRREVETCDLDNVD